MYVLEVLQEAKKFAISASLLSKNRSIKSGVGSYRWSVHPRFQFDASKKRPWERKELGKKRSSKRQSDRSVLAASVTGGQSLARTLGCAAALLANVVSTAPTSPAPATP